MKAVVAAFNQEKALVGAFSELTNLRMELFQALANTDNNNQISAQIQMYAWNKQRFCVSVYMTIVCDMPSYLHFKTSMLCLSYMWRLMSIPGCYWDIWMLNMEVTELEFLKFAINIVFYTHDSEQAPTIAFPSLVCALFEYYCVFITVLMPK